MNMKQAIKEASYTYVAVAGRTTAQQCRVQQLMEMQQGHNAQFLPDIRMRQRAT